MIKNRINFVVGICCGVCFVIQLLQGRDGFILAISAMATLANIALGIRGDADE